MLWGLTLLLATKGSGADPTAEPTTVYPTSAPSYAWDPWGVCTYCPTLGLTCPECMGRQERTRECDAVSDTCEDINGDLIETQRQWCYTDVNPTCAPTAKPTFHPSFQPTPRPTAQPTPGPTPGPTEVPTPGPTEVPTTKTPTLSPTTSPTPVSKSLAVEATFHWSQWIGGHTAISTLGPFADNAGMDRERTEITAWELSGNDTVGEDMVITYRALFDNSDNVENFAHNVDSTVWRSNFRSDILHSWQEDNAGPSFMVVSEHSHDYDFPEEEPAMSQWLVGLFTLISFLGVMAISVVVIHYLRKRWKKQYKMDAHNVADLLLVEQKIHDEQRELQKHLQQMQWTQDPNSPAPPPARMAQRNVDAKMRDLGLENDRSSQRPPTQMRQSLDVPGKERLVDAEDGGKYDIPDEHWTTAGDVEAQRPASIRLSKSFDDRGSGMKPIAERRYTSPAGSPRGVGKPNTNRSISNRDVHRNFRKEVKRRSVRAGDLSPRKRHIRGGSWMGGQANNGSGGRLFSPSRASSGATGGMYASGSSGMGRSPHNPRHLGFGPMDADGDIAAPRGSKLVSMKNVLNIEQPKQGLQLQQPSRDISTRVPRGTFTSQETVFDKTQMKSG